MDDIRQRNETTIVAGGVREGRGCAERHKVLPEALYAVMRWASRLARLGRVVLISIELHVDLPTSAFYSQGVMRIQLRRSTRALLASTAALAAGACTQRAPAPLPSYRPQSRSVTVTTVPLLVKEQRSVFPFLASAFAKGGTLEGKEVYAFSPSTITIVEGDTLHLTLINPEDDVHSFVLPDLAVSLPGNTTTQATYVARRAGIFPITCAVASHLPMMSGQLVVLSANAMAGTSTATASNGSTK